MEIEIAVLRELVAVLRQTHPSRNVYAAAGFQATVNPQIFISAGPLPVELGTHVQTHRA